MLKVPGISCVALVWASSAAPDKEPGLREAERAAHALGLQIQYFEIRKNEDWEAAVTAVSKARPKPDAVFQLCDPVTLSRRKALVDFAAKSRLPSMYEMKEYVVEGGLMAYGPSLAAMGRRSAYFARVHPTQELPTTRHLDKSKVGAGFHGSISAHSRSLTRLSQNTWSSLFPYSISSDSSPQE
jgi:hypothetical protein